MHGDRDSYHVAAPGRDREGCLVHAIQEYRRVKFGDDVILRRGGHPDKRPGQFRDVRARYIGARGHGIYCELLQDDPDAVVQPKTKGGKGWWSRSIMRRGDSDLDGPPEKSDE